MNTLKGIFNRQSGRIAKRGVVPKEKKETRQYVCGEQGCGYKTVEDIAPYGVAEWQAGQHMSDTINTSPIEGGCIPPLGTNADRRSHILQRIER